MKFSRLLPAALLLASLSTALWAQTSGLANSTVLIIRHAEKPETGTGLTPAGEARAKAYVTYFEHYKVGSKPIHIDYIFATKDGKNSARERLTVAPLAEALHLKSDLRYKNGAVDDLATDMKAKHYGNNVLICWHHGKIAKLVDDLGADSSKLIPGGKWPDDVFDWVIQLSYDKSGQLIKERAVRIQEPKFKPVR